MFFKIILPSFTFIFIFDSSFIISLNIIYLFKIFCRLTLARDQRCPSRLKTCRCRAAAFEKRSYRAAAAPRWIIKRSHCAAAAPRWFIKISCRPVAATIFSKTYRDRAAAAMIISKTYCYRAAAATIFSKTYRDRAATAMTFPKICRDRAAMDISARDQGNLQIFDPGFEGVVFYFF